MKKVHFIKIFRNVKFHFGFGTLAHRYPSAVRVVSHQEKHWIAPADIFSAILLM